MKILNFPDDNTIFLLRDINYHTRTQSILKSHERACSSKLINQDNWYSHNCILDNLLIAYLITTTGTNNK